MAGSNFRNRSVDVHNFAMIPKADIPRSAFRMQHVHKTSFDAGYLIPMYVDEMLPGDTFNMRMTGFVRLATPLFPTLDNLHCDTFFFVVPMRLVWDNFDRFMGARRPNVDSSTSYVIPECSGTAGGYAIGSIFDYMGLPTVGQVAGANVIEHNVLPLRAFNLIYNEWFRDQNLVNSLDVRTDDGPDSAGLYGLPVRGKRHDYFTGALPFPQKGTEVSIPLGSSAPIVSTGTPTFQSSNTSAAYGAIFNTGGALSTLLTPDNAAMAWDNPNLEADLSAATAATVNLLRQSFQVQKLLERDARGGTRYTEIVRAHFNVVSPDARLQRPEYVGGGSSTIVINPIAQTSGTNIDGSDTPQGNLAAVGTGLVQSGFTYSATEHSYVIGIVNVRADLTYQQGLRKIWFRSTRFDFYWPVFAALGEQRVWSKELFVDGSVDDETVFGYQERWAEYRYFPSMITSLMRSTAASTIDPWHYAEEFATRPLLNSTFIGDPSRATVARATAVGAGANGQQFLADFFFDNKAARPMPMYSVPGLIDHL